MNQKRLYEKEKARILKAALADLPFDGFTDEILTQAAAKARVSADKTRLAFPRGGIDLAVAFIQAGTAEMVKQLAAQKLETMKVRERIQTAVMTRLMVDAPNRETARRAFALLALPRHGEDAVKLLGTTVDEMWRAAGDTSTDVNYYSKRVILSGVYTSTRLVWFQDESDDYADTRVFLERRIDNVMQIEKGKAKWRQFKDKLPDPLSALAKQRYRV
ncbi:MAG: COQ9 family protein [Parvibaculales bacterium]